MTDALSALTVARFLQENPDFFSEHAELFAALTVPHPSDTRAISLGERQIMTLRDRHKALEQRLAILTHQAEFNQSVAQNVSHWCEQLLAVDNPEELPGHIVGGLLASFDIPDVALKLWGVAWPQGPFTSDIDTETQTFVAALKSPYCGPNQDFGVAQWFKAAPASLAIIPIHREAQVIGVLALGSPDPERFASDMGTTFLESIGRLTSAALARLPSAN